MKVELTFAVRQNQPFSIVAICLNKCDLVFGNNLYVRKNYHVLLLYHLSSGVCCYTCEDWVTKYQPVTN